MKKFTFSLLCFFLIFGASVYAESIQVYIGKKIEGQFPVSMNGEKVEQPGLVIEGVSYLPVRVIGEMMECEVLFIDQEIILDCEKEEPTEEALLPVEEGEKMIGDDLKFVDVPDERLIESLEMQQVLLETYRLLLEDENNSTRDLTNIQREYNEIERRISEIKEELELRSK